MFNIGIECTAKCSRAKIPADSDRKSNTSRRVRIFSIGSVIRSLGGICGDKNADIYLQ